jgi:hypothetical protein
MYEYQQRAIKARMEAARCSLPLALAYYLWNSSSVIVSSFLIRSVILTAIPVNVE